MIKLIENYDPAKRNEFVEVSLEIIHKWYRLKENYYIEAWTKHIFSSLTEINRDTYIKFDIEAKDAFAYGKTFYDTLYILGQLYYDYINSGEEGVASLARHQYDLKKSPYYSGGSHIKKDIQKLLDNERKKRTFISPSLAKIISSAKVPINKAVVDNIYTKFSHVSEKSKIISQFNLYEEYYK